MFHEQKMHSCILPSLHRFTQSLKSASMQILTHPSTNKSLIINHANEHLLSIYTYWSVCWVCCALYCSAWEVKVEPLGPVLLINTLEWVNGSGLRAASVRNSLCIHYRHHNKETEAKMATVEAIIRKMDKIMMVWVFMVLFGYFERVKGYKAGKNTIRAFKAPFLFRIFFIWLQIELE